MALDCREKLIKEANPIKGQGGARQQTMDRVCLYLRLFMGMGVIWYFEIISWAVGSEAQGWTYFFDCFNMLQVSVSVSISISVRFRFSFSFSIVTAQLQPKNEVGVTT